MSKQKSTKCKQPPWIPPGANIQKSKKLTKPPPPNSSDPVSPRVLTSRTFTKEDVTKDIEPDILSMSSQSSVDLQKEPDIHLLSIYQEMKLLYVHFESLKSSYLSTHRLIDSEDNSVKQLLAETGICVRELNVTFDDLEYSVSVLENTLDENQREQEHSKASVIKINLLSKLLHMYEKIIIILQTVFEKQDFKGISQLNESLSTKLKLTEKKSISQEAIIKDLERRLSILQSKTNAVESYKTNLECTKTELEKQLLHKESQIKYLNDELMNSSNKQINTDHRDFIEVIEAIKSKAHFEKSRLKKALKYQRVEFKKQEEKYQELMQEFHERMGRAFKQKRGVFWSNGRSIEEKMGYNLADQRDQLKIQLTMFNNTIIQQKSALEEMKIQQLKLQSEITEKEISNKKNTNKLQNSLDEMSAEVSKLTRTKSNLEKTIEDLENERQIFQEKLSNEKEQHRKIFVNLHKPEETDVMHKLMVLLQNTMDMLQSFNESAHIASDRRDSTTSDADGGCKVKNDILAAVAQTNEHLLELKKLCLSQGKSEQQIHTPKKNDLEKQLKKMEERYNAALKENQDLKQEVDELKNSSVTSPTVQKTENYFTTNIPSDSIKRKFQLEVIKKNDEIVRMKYDFKMRERDWEDQIKKYKDKLKTMEVDGLKISRLEEELRNTKLELSILQKKKEEETERLLQRARDLQDSLDLKNDQYEIVQRYVQFLKSSYSNVFGDS